MDHGDHVSLIAPGVRAAVQTGAHPRGQAWADLGSGEGAFTLALADLLGPGATIHSVDRDAGALARQAEAMSSRFPRVTLRQLLADFTRPLPLAALDGMVMANSLHFVRRQGPVLALVHGYLRDGGRLVLVEYDADRGNPWVPYPVSYQRWQPLAAAAGFRDTQRIGRVPSRFLGAIYAAVSVK